MDVIVLGRGPAAVADMKARIALLRAAGLRDRELFSILWDRNRRAVFGEGYTYEFAGIDAAVALRPDGDVSWPAGR